MLARSMILGLTWSALALLPIRATDLPTQYLPVYGGSGGSAFTRSCGDNRVISGIRFRAGLQLDAIGLMCRPVNADGSLGAQTTVGTLVGGSGGESDTRSCPSGSVVVGAIINHGAWVDGVRLSCRPWNASTRSYAANGTVLAIAGRIGANLNIELCEVSTQPAVGIRGRSASLVDAIGFVCNEP